MFNHHLFDCLDSYLYIFIKKPKLSCVLFGSEVLMARFACRVCGVSNRLLDTGGGEISGPMLNSPLCPGCRVAGFLVD